MFNNMRNQLRDKTGKDLPKFNPQKGTLSRSSRQGSESSLSSLVLDPNPQPPLQNSTSSSPTPDLHQIKLADGKVLTPKEVNIIAKKEDEWRSRLEKKDSEWTKKFEKRESELLKELEDKESEWRGREHSLTEDLLKQTTELKEALSSAEEYKRKVIQYQEDKDQVESFQTQEMAKIKHLLLAKERENGEMSATLKENLALVEMLKSEVSRLRPFEEKVTNIEDEMETLRHTSEKERQSLSRRLTESEEEVRHLKDRVEVLTKRSETDLSMEPTPDSRIQGMLGERALLERRLEETHIHLTDIKASWSAQISSLETQVGRLSRQAGEEGVERRRAESRVQELDSQLAEEAARSSQLTEKLSQANHKIESLAFDLEQLVKQNEALKSDKEGMEKELTRIKCDLEKEQNRLLASEELAQQQEQRAVEAEAAAAAANSLVERLSTDLESATRAQEGLELRNAQLSQAGDIARADAALARSELDTALASSAGLQQQLFDSNQDLSAKKKEMEELVNKLSSIEGELVSVRTLEERNSILTTTVSDLEAQLADRNKTIKVLQQNLNDMKKTLQRELKASGAGPDGDGVNHSGPATLALAPQHTVQLGLPRQPDTDVNFQYLKHVIVKFLTSREYEAQQLTKAVATLLNLSPEEELLIKDTLDWKMSWFRSRPRLQDYS